LPPAVRLLRRGEAQHIACAPLAFLARGFVTLVLEYGLAAVLSNRVDLFVYSLDHGCEIIVTAKIVNIPAT
jgi:hypothetical protein